MAHAQRESGYEQILMKARSLPMKGSENRCGFVLCNGGDMCAVFIPPERSDWAVKLMDVGSRVSRSETPDAEKGHQAN